MRFILSYINTSDSEVYLDQAFDTMVALMAFVNREHGNWTSYEIVVLKM